MEIGLTEEQEELRTELREYYANLLTPDVEAELAVSGGVGPTVRRIVKQMAADGWLGIGWPTEYGGQGRSAVEQFIFFDESMRSGAPVPMLTINTVGPTIMSFGSERTEGLLPAEDPRRRDPLLHRLHGAQRRDRPCRARDQGCRRRRRAGHKRQKIFTSLAGDADYCWLAVRTNPEAKKHKGISIVIVPMDTPGVRVVPMQLMGEHNINTTYWEDVRVPLSNVVGGLNNGWSLITNQLNHERVTLCSPGIIERALSDVLEWAKETKLADGRRVIDQEWVRINLAKVHAKLEFLGSSTGRSHGPPPRAISTWQTPRR